MVGLLILEGIPSSGSFSPSAILEHLCNGRTYGPGRLPSSIFSGRMFFNCTRILWLRQDCMRIVDCECCSPIFSSCGIETGIGNAPRVHWYCSGMNWTDQDYRFVWSVQPCLLFDVTSRLPLWLEYIGDWSLDCDLRWICQIKLIGIPTQSWNWSAMGERTAPDRHRPIYILVLYSLAVCSSIARGF